MSYEKPTISSGLQAVYYQDDQVKAAINSLLNEPWNGQPNQAVSQQVQPLSPRGLATKLLKDMKGQNKEIAKHIKAYNAKRK